jgi:hypothetical protein
MDLDELTEGAMVYVVAWAPERQLDSNTLTRNAMDRGPPQTALHAIGPEAQAEDGTLE